MQIHDRIHGCLLGGACGDALGAPVEFLTLEEITQRYGPEGITEFDTAYGILGAITDDTQMTLFTVEGLIRAAVRSASKGICHPPSVVYHAYQRWLATQDEPFDSLRSHEDFDGWLIQEKRLWVRRAPGNTCLSALRASKYDMPAQNNSKGCGTVMRDAPFGFIGLGAEESFELAAATASTTHGHPSAYCSSGALAAIISFVADGNDLRAAVEQTLLLLQSRSDAAEVRSALDHAMELSSSKTWREQLPRLGTGWVAEEALAISALCALSANNPREAIIAAVNHSGDSDSTGAITGNLVGALRGPASLPVSWVEQVELRDVIHVLARDFATVVAEPFELEALWERYPGW